jgi:hypothetical protein
MNKNYISLKKLFFKDRYECLNIKYVYDNCGWGEVGNRIL